MTAPSPSCTCVAEQQVKLAQDNTRLVLTWCSDTRQVTPTIVTQEIDPRDREAVLVVPIYCPFCGVPYGKPAEENRQ
jgi:hypothetical protein